MNSTHVEVHVAELLGHKAKVPEESPNHLLLPIPPRKDLDVVLVGQQQPHRCWELPRHRDVLQHSAVGRVVSGARR